MHPYTKELINHTKQTLGLQGFHLFEYSISSKRNDLNEITYILSMEWFPPGTTERDEDGSNPEGTAVIEIDIHSRQFKSIIFVGGKTDVTLHQFDTFENIETVSRWVEKQTGLKSKEHFFLSKQTDREICFNLGHQGVRISPSQFVEMHVDEAGRLVFYSVSEGFRDVTNLIKKETFRLQVQDIASIINEQLQLIQYPDTEHGKWDYVFGLEEIYVRNSDYQTIPFEMISGDGPILRVNEIVEWDSPLAGEFKVEQIDLGTNDEVTMDDALSKQSNKRLLTVSKQDRKGSIKAIVELLRQEFSSESGKWKVSKLVHDQGYILAKVELLDDQRLLSRKLMIFIDPNSFKVVNYVDNSALLEMYGDLQEANPIVISKQEAFEKLQSHITLKPVYLFDPVENAFVLCGTLDCNLAVKGDTGEVADLNSIW